MLKGFGMNFNSSLVRLKEREFIIKDNVGLFQFQLGAIKRRFEDFGFDASKHFNSSLVRLKGSLPIAPG